MPREDRLEQRHAFGRILGDRRGGERLLDALAQRGRRKLWHRWQAAAARGGHQGQVHSGQPRRDAQLGDRFVEHRRQLRDVRRPIAMMGRGPCRELPAGIGGERQPARSILRQSPRVERARDVRAERVEVGLALRRRVVARTGRLRISVRALPVDRRLRDADEVERRRRRVESADRNGEHDAVGDAREVAVAHQGRAILQEDAVQQRVGGQRRRRSRGNRSRHSHCQQRGAAAGPAGTISKQHGRSQRSGTLANPSSAALWPDPCGKAVEESCIGCGTDRRIKYFSCEDRRRSGHAHTCVCAFVSPFA